MKWSIADQADDVFKPDQKLIQKVLRVTDEYRRGLTTKEEYLDVLLELVFINRSSSS